MSLKIVEDFILELWFWAALYFDYKINDMTILNAEITKNTLEQTFVYYWVFIEIKAQIWNTLVSEQVIKRMFT